MSEDTAAALLETVQSFYPEASVSRSSGRDRDLAFRALPNLARPRLLVPGSTRAPASRALLRFSVALGARDAISRIVAAGGVRALGVARLLPEGIAVQDAHGDDMAQHLAGQLGEPVVFSVGIGTARANRKPILEVFSRRSGRTLAFAKVGDSPTASARVQAEAGALAELVGRLGAGFEIPRIISVSRWRDQDVLLLTPLRTLPQVGARGRAPLAQMRAFSDAFGEGPTPLPEVPQWRRLRAGTLPAAPIVDRWAESAARVEAHSGAYGPVPVGAWHGDWTAWNMAWRGRRLQLWDFERFETGAVQGLDVVHYPVNEFIVGRGLSRDRVLEGVERGVRDLGGTRTARLVAAVYLLAVTARYLESVGQTGEHLVLERTSAMLDALDAWIERRVISGGN